MRHAIDVEALARQAAGNHKDFVSFAWHDEPEDSENWCIVHTNNRDSGLLNQSNAAAIANILEPHILAEEEDVRPMRCAHWGCGWVDGYALRVYRNGEITAAFTAWCEIVEALEDYPVLDEEDHSRREYEAALYAIEDVGAKYVVSGATDETWPQHVFSWLWKHNQRELDPVDDGGANPSEEAVRNALEALGWLDTEYLEDEE